MAKASSDKPQTAPISTDPLDARKAQIERQQREIALGLEQLEADRRSLQVERNALLAQKTEIEMLRRKLATDTEHFRKLTSEITRLARTV